MISALFVVLSLIALSTGIAYSFYLDLIVPIIISLMYLKCDFKYTILSCITSLIIIVFVIGDVGSGIWMSQSMIVGLICGAIIPRKTLIVDDLLYSAIASCFVMLLINLYFSKLLGFDFIKDIQVMIEPWNINETLKNVLYYICIAALPLGTTILVYFATLLIGKKLKLLSEDGKKKFKASINFIKCSGYFCCSEKATIISIIYLVSLKILSLFNYSVKHIYLKTLLVSIQCIVLYFVIKDFYSFICKFIYIKTKSNIIVRLSSLVILFLLIYKFQITAIVIIVVGFIIDHIFKMRKSHINVMEQYLSS
ncbi:DUF2232 domain-containing protein [Clostridium ihumii]|uniref:DUF2232 domain-containing protein n=1 Tax=Clostridium ihumii TaxID=1470356 RepID=UPI003D3566DD